VVAPKTRPRELYVEGGGDKNPSLASECRKAFSKLFEKAGIAQRPKVIACGGRQAAYERFCIAFRTNEADVWLLVDAEEVPAPGASSWAHVKARVGDGWAQPGGATDDHLHLMSVTMETWLVADPDALAKTFGSKFDRSKLPPAGPALEQQTKADINAALAAAAKPTASGAYAKGAHSFKTLGEVEPAKLGALPAAARLLLALR
jgi:hypothetical protein